MLPKKYLQKMAANIVKRSGIARPTVEALLPHVFDEIRYQLTEGQYPCVPIESFGTFAIIDMPERRRRYTYKGKNEIHTLPAKKKLKFAPTRNLKREIEAGRFDPTRKSFSRHPDDPKIRKRANMKYNKRSEVYLEHLPDED
jgi:nucleoid DNA-binding protein